MIDLPQEQLDLIRSILNRHIPGSEVRAFGSRVNGTAKPYSDIDLVVMGQERVPQKLLYQLKDNFEESTLSIRVDLVDWHRISAEFRSVIEKKYQIIQPGK